MLKHPENWLHARIPGGCVQVQINHSQAAPCGGVLNMHAHQAGHVAMQPHEQHRLLLLLATIIGSSSNINSINNQMVTHYGRTHAD